MTDFVPPAQSWSSNQGALMGGSPTPQKVRELEFAYNRDGKVMVGFSNETEEGGFTVLGYANDALNPYLTALIWCSGSGDFAPLGQARQGWEKLVKPLLDRVKSLQSESWT